MKDARDRSDPYAIVEHRKKDSGEEEIVFSINFVPYRESPEYEAYAQKVLEDLRDRTIDKCSGR